MLNFLTSQGNRYVGVRLQGGLGNQMFQYAAARNISHRLNAKLVLDLSWFLGRNEKHLQYSLSDFRIIGQKKYRAKILPKRFRNIYYKVTDKFSGLGLGREVFFEKSFQFDAKLHQINRPIVLDGYWQSPRYFNEINHILIEEFKIKDKLNKPSLKILDQINKSQSICIHIRRGDYANNRTVNAIHGTCPISYYQNGVDMLSLGLHSPKAFVFSDDPAWARENIKLPIETIIVDVNNVDQPCSDMSLMAACSYFVISNSTFSWWAAWLSTAGMKKVVAPKKWFVSGKNRTLDLIPDTWQRI